MSSLLAMGCLTASAQKEAKTEYVFTPHWYLQAQVGGQYTLGELSFKDLISPNAQLFPCADGRRNYPCRIQ